MSSTSPKLVVTGVASGIGKETANELRSQGYEILGVDRAAVENFEGTFIQGDLSTQDGIDGVVQSIAAAAPEGIQGLANIAGVPGTAPAEVVLNINVFGLRDLTYALRPLLQPGSAVVNLASAVAYQWRASKDRLAGFALASDREVALQTALADQDIMENSYLFSKQCVQLLSEYLAAEFLEDKIRVNSVSPGPVETPILEDFKNDHGREKVNSAAQVVGRFGTPVDIAQCVAFAFTPAAAWINGTDLRADGGLTAYRETAALREAHVTPSQV
ncbi:SDR family oxidoreductase [Yaniella halotolerans]|uniref:SDR family oxidoreductase n=1 Tax=Yaniella halotolerans TaxID=225453 RepID=UPI0003B45560|nr:SDR family oxidoreductase [Yaniella halotolerans]